MTEIDRRFFTAAVLRASDPKDEAKGRTIVGHAAVFDETIGFRFFKERIAKGAFVQTIKEDDIRALFNHNPDHVLGRNTAGSLSLEEDEKGLAVEITPIQSTRNDELLDNIREGNISQMSIGFRVVKESFEELEDGTDLRTIEQVKLFDVSPVTFPAYESTDVSVRSFEAWKESRAQNDHAQIKIAHNHRRRRLDLIGAERL